MKPKKIFNPPDPRRTSQYMRESGYSFNSAVADLIDNSIMADADTINIELGVTQQIEPFFSIGDNGHGMDESELIDAMQYGSTKKDIPQNLGKFGIGLKSSSSAFCTKFSLISRRQEKSKALKASWDLDHVNEVNDWYMEISDPQDSEESELDFTAGGGPGTLLLWENIDRIIDKFDKEGQTLTDSTVKTRMKKRETSLKEHLGMTFNRFINPSSKKKKPITIRLNGDEIEGWDPFAINEEYTEQNDLGFIPIKLPDGQQTGFRLIYYILPRPEEFSTNENRSLSRIGDSSTSATKWQGFYVYRENRLISNPTWLGTRQVEPHMNSLRIAIFFDHTMDPAFNVDMKKSQIRPSPEIQSYLENTTKLYAQQARKQSDKGREEKLKRKDIHKNSENTIAAFTNEGNLTMPTVKNIDEGNSTVIIKNNHGDTQLTMPIISNPGEKHISKHKTLDEGTLWEPGLINGVPGGHLNTGHPYYQKTWETHQDDTNIVQALDYFIWALATAETNNTNSEHTAIFKQFRVDVSENLQKLIKYLPDPTID
tara:strand:- start:527 stop:2146 length:1620 start_codon:yes stop_codon:yes gene_type:complete